MGRRLKELRNCRMLIEVYRRATKQVLPMERGEVITRHLRVWLQISATSECAGKTRLGKIGAGSWSSSETEFQLGASRRLIRARNETAAMQSMAGECDGRFRSPYLVGAVQQGAIFKYLGWGHHFDEYICTNRQCRGHRAGFRVQSMDANSRFKRRKLHLPIRIRPDHFAT